MATTHPETHPSFRAALRHLHRGEAEDARALLEPLHEAHPENVEIILNLGGSYVLLERYDDARAILEEAATRNPDMANLWVNLAAARLGRLEESSADQQAGAIAAYEQALQADPDAHNVHYMLGLIYQTQENHLQAVTHLMRAVEQNPEDRHAQSLLQAVSRELARNSKS